MSSIALQTNPFRNPSRSIPTATQAEAARFAQIFADMEPVPDSFTTEIRQSHETPRKRSDETETNPFKVERKKAMAAKSSDLHDTSLTALQERGEALPQDTVRNKVTIHHALERETRHVSDAEFIVLKARHRANVEDALDRLTSRPYLHSRQLKELERCTRGLPEEEIPILIQTAYVNAIADSIPFSQALIRAINTSRDAFSMRALDESHVRALKSAPEVVKRAEHRHYHQQVNKPDVSARSASHASQGDLREGILVPLEDG